MQEKILTDEARQFLELLHREFNGERLRLLEERQSTQSKLNQGWEPAFVSDTESIRKDPTWRVAEIPADLKQRWVEITGPVERKMMINAFNSGADVFMADFEDSLSPTWKNVLEGQQNLIEAVRRKLFFNSAEGKEYRLNAQIATLIVRPRGWHLEEKHYKIERESISASIFDFGLYLFHNARTLLENGSGPYFYLPKLENRFEAKLWNDLFAFSERTLNLPAHSIKATVLIETILAAFEMEEILYELKDYIVGLNAGRWDYIFSIIKKFAFRNDLLFPDRGEISMRVPFMQAYAHLLVQTAHKRGAQAIGGMAAFIPNRKDKELNEKALAKVREDKLREFDDGFDGTWVAHPDLVPIAHAIFQQKQPKKNTMYSIQTKELLNFAIPESAITAQGVLQNVSVALQYLESWLRGVGAVALDNLMEDAATAEISRAQLWQWIHHGAVITENQRPITIEMVKELLEKERACLQGVKENPEHAWTLAYTLLKQLIEREAFTEFLTVEAYQWMNHGS